MRSKPGDHQDGTIHAHLHQRHVPNQDLFGLHLNVVDIATFFVEFIRFKFTADIRFDHTDPADVFLYGCVQCIVFAKHFFKYGVNDKADRKQSNSQKDDHDDENQ